MSRNAIVNITTTLVENVCVWDGSTPWTPPDGCEAVPIANDSIVTIGYCYMDGVFVSPPEPVVLPPEPIEAP